LLGSDKTHLTVFAGDKNAWPLYLSIGNIKSSVRNKPKNHTWVLVAYLPIARFLDDKSIHTVLQSRLFHQCIELALKPLKETAQGVIMTDSLGAQRRCFPVLAAYLADYPEQLLVNAAAHNTSPTTWAFGRDLGNSRPSSPRGKYEILAMIAELERSVGSADIAAYETAAKLKGLNGVNRPFWREMRWYRPDLCVAPDILHGVHRFWRDHILKWVINLVGEEELDKRVKALQPEVGFRHFKDGISHLSQWSGREDRELQRILFAVVFGSSSINANALQALRGIHDFIYLAQYTLHSEDTLGYLKRGLDLFHKHKQEFIKTGARRGKSRIINNFNIPKLYALLTFANHIRQMGTCPQFSTEITENCHQTMAKQAYRATNKRDFEVQMCRYLDRSDRISTMKEVFPWWTKQERRDTIEGTLKDRPLDYQTLARSLLFDNADEEMVSISGRQRHGHIWHNLRPHMSKQNLQDLAAIYKLPHFLDDFGRFLRQCGTPQACGLSFSDKVVDVWHNCRIQLPLVQEENENAAMRTVQALPPSPALPHGRCSCVLVTKNKNAKPEGIKGSYSLCMVFSC
jgi:hypothetical protein